MFKKIKCLVFAGWLLASQSVSASLWLPSAPDVGMSAVTFAGSSLQNAKFGIFDAGNNAFFTKPVATFIGNSTVTFMRNGVNWDVSVNGKTASLSGSNQFQLAWYSNGTWISDASIAPSATTPNLWELTFLDSANGSAKETVSVSNIEPAPQPVASESYNISAVPLSATAWAFLSGLIGSLAVSKRRVVNK